MRYKHTHDSGSHRLILIFAGWSTDASFYSGIAPAGYDVMVVYDYTDMDFPLECLDRYSTICLFAWSLGVFAASCVIPSGLPSMAVAVNGTETPVDDDFGIPESIFKGTAANLDDRNLIKFRRRMCADAYQSLAGKFGDRTTESLRNELEAIARHSSTHKSHLHWDRVYVSTRDTIFPPANQMHAWKSHPSGPEIRSVQMPHYINLADIIRGAIPTRNTISDKFRKALPTYSDNASAQRTIASALLDMIPEVTIEKGIEIGPGSGIFTEMFCKRFKPREMDFVDLYPLPDYGYAIEERYHICDAEDWMENAGNEDSLFDAIVSASAIQWFVNPERFFHNVSRMLKTGGILACSTFLPGNLEELYTSNPFGLIYRDKTTIREILQPYFDNVRLEEEEITLTFDSQRELLLHLRHTGVGGASSSPLPLSQLLASLPQHLTYRPLYIIARR